MSRTETPVGEITNHGAASSRALMGVGLGALGVFGAVWAYWMVVPGIVLGIAAIVLGIAARRQGTSEAGSIAIALGVVALFLVPSVLFMADGAEDWGRDCALNPSNPDC